MTLIQCEGCETLRKNKSTMYHQNNEEIKNKQDGEEGAGFDTRVLASENVLPKGQRENTK